MGGYLEIDSQIEFCLLYCLFVCVCCLFLFLFLCCLCVLFVFVFVCFLGGTWKVVVKLSFACFVVFRVQ